MAKSIKESSSRPSPDDRSGEGATVDRSDELLDDGQEEVFSRFEVEHGLIEHHSGTDGPGAADPKASGRRGTGG